MSDFPLALAVWLGTYLLHSTVLLGLVGIVDRLRLLRSPAVLEQLWRAALIGGLATATLQSAGVAGRAPMAALFSLADSLAAAELRPAGGAGGEAAPAPPATSLVGSIGTVLPPSHPAAAPRRSWVPGAATALVLLWLAGAGLCALRLAALAWRARSDLAGRFPAAAAMRSELARICAAQGRTAPALTVTPKLAGPVAFPNGEIVLPPWVSETLDLRQQRAVLAHELAHQIRRDPLWLVLALALANLLWMQPLQRLARRRIAELAELEADAWAVRLLGDPRALAESLAACAERLVSRRQELWSAGMVAGSQSASPLLERIDLLLKGIAMSTPRSLWPTRAAAALVLAAGIFLLPGCGPAGFASLGGGSSTSISISDGGDIRMTVRRAGYSLKLTCDGQPTFADDESDLATLSPGAAFEMTERLDAVERRYRVKADASGRLERSFELDGRSSPIDAAAEAWLAAALPRMFRESGWDAEARVARLVTRGGPELVLAEVDLAATDHGKSTYLGQLLGTAQLDAAQFERALASASKLGSDHALRTALEVALTTQPLDTVRVVQLLAVAEKLDSDFELRMVLEKVAPRGGDAAVAAAYLAAARRLESDFERRSALVGLLEAAKLDAPSLGIALEVAAGLDSDFEKRTVLEELAANVASDPGLTRRYREVARGMSEFERGQALRALDDATTL